MIKKKVCLIGGFAVGKTSLVQQFVSGIFSDNYLTTVGVKIDKRTVQVDERETLLMIWDIAGSDQFAAVTKSYLRGTNGFIYVADGTRRETLDAVAQEHALVSKENPDVPAILLINKSDLTAEWEVTSADISIFEEKGMTVFHTSAKSGNHVAESFEALAGIMLDSPPKS